MPETESALDVPDTSSFGVGFMPQAAPPAAAEPSRSGSDLVADVLNPQRTAAITSQHADIERQHGQEMNYADRQLDDRMREDRSRMDRAYRAEGAAADALPPKWDADKERSERVRGPMEQFGSIGTVFAMAASLFTKAPMTSALNAGASAMRAIQEHDEHGYQSAYQAWKDNTTLALKRFDMERAMFADADKLLSTDINAWRTKQMSIAAKFDNQKALMFLENGMDKELLEMQSSQIKAAGDLQKTVDGMEQYDLRRTVWKNDPRASGTPEQRLELLHEMAGGKLSTEEQLLRDFRRDRRAETGEAPKAEEESKFLREYKQFGARGSANPEWNFMSKRVEELVKPADEGGEGLSPTDAMRKAQGEWRASKATPAREGTEPEFIKKRKAELMQPKEDGGEGLSDTEAAKKAKSEWTAAGRREPVVTPGRQISTEVERRKADYIAGGMDESEAFKKASQEVRRETQTPGGNRISQLQSRVDAIGYSRYTMDKAEQLMNRHWGITGLGGSITRPMESVSNATGFSNATDRRQFERFIEEMKEWGPTVLLDRSGRPLSTEATRMNAIIAGLRMGDTVANTKRAFSEMRQLWSKIEGQVQSQIDGTWQPGGRAPKPGTGGNWWQKIPDKRTEIAADTEAA